MRVAKSVLRPDGAVLLNEGAELDEDELANLHKRGVEFVFVAVADDRDDATRAAEDAQKRARIEFIFRPADADCDARNELKAAILTYRLGDAC